MIDENDRLIDLDIPENERHPVDVRIEEAIPPVEAGGAPSGEEEGIETLRAAKAKLEEDLRTERTQRQQRESELAQHQSEVQRMREEGGRGQLQHRLALVDGELTRLNGLVEQAVKRRTEALQQGDFAEEAQINRAIAAGEAQLHALRSHKVQIEGAIKNGLPPAAEGRVPEQPPQRQLPEDPVERMIVGANLQGRSAEWVRSHPEVATSSHLQAKVGFAHQDALAAGLADGSDDYFAHVDRVMGYGGGEGQQAQPQRRPAMAAPVSPSSPGGAPRQTARTIRLTAEQREAARISGISEADYAKQLIRLQASDASTRH